VTSAEADRGSAPTARGSAAPDLALFGGVPVLARGSHTLWPIVTEAERGALTRVLDRGILSGPFAPEAMAFQEEFARFVEAKHAVLTHCGTSALSIALAASGVGAGDEVIVPAYSFVATPLAVAHIGAVPVFADVDVLTGCLDPEAARAAITPRTRAIMPVHMHGCAADMTAFVSLAKRHGLVVVEDAAQAHGARCGGRAVGALASAGGFSLQSSKNLPAGEGGVLVTNDVDIAERAHSIRNFGQNVSLTDAAEFSAERPLDGSKSFDSQRLGSMFRGNEMMAAFARAQLSRLAERTERGQRNAERLSHALGELPGVIPPQIPPGRTSVHHKFRVKLDPARAGLDIAPDRLRDAMVAALRAEGLEVVLWQSVSLPAQSVFQKRDASGGFPAPRSGGTDLARNYDPARYPNTNALLAGSLVLFSQSCPLIAQSDEIVDRYAEAFGRVWQSRSRLADWAARAAQ
jgi:perosamine synthetase